MRTPALPSRRRRGLAGLTAASLVAAPLALGLVTPANATSPNVVISEVYGGGGNGTAPTYTNDFVELYNAGSAAVNVAGWSVQYRSAAGTSAQVTPLTGTIQPGSYYLVQQAAGTTAGSKTLPAPDATGSIGMSGTGGVVLLANNTTGITAVGNLAANATPPPPANLVDMVGFGTTPTSFETARTGVALSEVLSAQRAGTDTDDNAVNFIEAIPEAQNSGPAAPTALAATDPADPTGQVGSPVTGFTLQATGGTSPYTWTATGTPPGVSVATNGAVSGTPTTQGVYTVTATATDSATTPATDSVEFTFTISASAVLRPIAEIQGTGATSPYDGQGVITEGVVTAAYPTGGLNGFYIQTPGADTPSASDAIFVYGGTGGFTTYPAVSDSVRVSGTAAEFSGQTQIIASQSGVEAIASLGTVTPKTLVPGTDCALPGTACLGGAELNAVREVAESELFQPSAPWTATDVYDGSPFYQGTANSGAFRGEIGVAAQSAMPLVAPTEIIDAQATAQIADRTKYNNAHRVVMDDGSSLTYSTSQNSGSAFPWFTAGHTVRVGAEITFPKPVVFTEGFGTWRILPQSQIVGAPTGQINVEQTRPAAPETVGGDVKLATFNVLNFFPTTGEEFVSAGLGTCTYFNDRAGARVTVNSCTNNGPRGAANDANLARQRDKIVAAINTANADIVSLEELENSVQFGKDRDFAINALVSALNADAGAGTWAAVPSPAASELPPLSEQDVIRNGFIYKPGNVALVGPSDVLADQSTGTEAFADAREPVAQAFKQVGTADADAFAVIVNHFKSKGSGTPDPDGQGNANDRRVLQANGLVTFADEFKTARGITRVFLAGDFNAYSAEDPIQVLNAAGYTNLESSSDPEEETYNFDGMVGSLDHVLANVPALADVSAVDVWDINGNESVYYEYARFNTNVTNLYAPNPFRSSDHSPEIVGINTAPVAAEPVDIQILGTNDFHGRILNENGTNGTLNGPTAGAAILSGAVKELRTAEPNTVFAAAGDLIGASTFESFILNDEPTIDALNAAGLDVSAVGNHEFDQGWDDLVNRVIPRAEWKYIGANVDKPTAPADELLEPTFVKEMEGVQVGFIGAVTEHLHELVSPEGIEGVVIEDIVAATNREADTLKADGVDVIVLLVHEGAPNTNCATMDDDATSDFGSIINGVNDKVDAIVSGHTHLAYDCSFPVAGWSDRPVTERPVVSAGQYGQKLNQLQFTVDPITGEVLTKAQAVLNLKAQTAPFAPNYQPDPAVTPIVDKAIADAGPLGAVELGKIEGPFYRAKLANGTTENRGHESTVSNLVAEVQRWATPATVGGAQIAFINPGGLRDDMIGTGADYPRTLTYRQAANVQSFANTLVNMDLTGAQLKAVLEQQWQPAGASRPFLRLGASEGFTHTFDASKPAGSRITGMWLNGEPIGLATSYSVTANSFLAGGGDNFPAFAGGTGKQDTGKVDLAAMVEYMEEFANSSEGDAPLPVDYSQRAVGVEFPVGAPTSYAAGDDVSFTMSSLSMSGPGDLTDAEVEVSLGDKVLGTSPVTTTVATALPGFDATGTASVTVEVPACATTDTLTVRGLSTGTEVLVPLDVTAPDCIVTTVTSTNTTIQEGASGSVPVQVAPSTATGDVILSLGQMTLETTLVNGAGSFPIAAGALPVGVHELALSYVGDDLHRSSTGTVVVTITAKPAPGAATTTVTGTAGAIVYGAPGSVVVKVAPATATGTVAVIKGADVLGSATLVSGAGTVALAAKSLPAGTHTLTLTYAGDAGHKASTGSVTVVVSKAEATARAKVKPKKVVAKKTTARIVVIVGAVGFTPTGRVKVRVAGKTYRASLENGKAVVRLKKFKKARTYTAKVSYLGDANTEADKTRVKIRVKRR